jgi:uncharacterized YigZ family protein
VSGDPTPYPVPARRHAFAETIERSRFLTTLAHTPDAAAAHRFVHAVRDEHPDATHHCWAYVAGPPGSTTSVGMSDDGEPHGTAGRPMLTTLLHSEVGEIGAVCVRWYGGTKLGTGGLVRAYGGGVKGALKGLEVVMRIVRAPLELVVGYPHVDGVQRLVASMDGIVDEEDYGAEVRYRIRIPELRLAAFERQVADLTAGEARVRRC